MMRRYLFLAVAALILFGCNLFGQRGGELRLCLRAEPKTFNPLLVDDEPSETIRYLTAGVLIRLNRRTQQLEPALAASWSLQQNGRKISFKLREGIAFSDGTPFSARDVAYTMRSLMDPALFTPQLAIPFDPAPVLSPLRWPETTV
jgi:peptide/nickel transport system substrate-binding protein